MFLYESTFVLSLSYGITEQQFMMAMFYQLLHANMEVLTPTGIAIKY